MRSGLLKELDGAAGLAQVGVGKAQVAEHATFASAVASLACDLEALLIELDGAAGLAQVGVGNAQVAERPTFRVTPFQSPGGGEHRFEPSNAFVRMLPQVEHVDTRVGICNAEFSRRFITASLLRCPALSGFDIYTLQIEESSPRRTSFLP